MDRAYRRVLSLDAFPLDWDALVTGAKAEGRFDEWVLCRLIQDSRAWVAENLAREQMGDDGMGFDYNKFRAFRRVAQLATQYPAETLASPAWAALLSAVVESTKSTDIEAQRWGFQMAHSLSTASVERSSYFMEAGVLMNAMSAIMYGQDEASALLANEFVEDATRNIPLVAQRMASEPFVKSVVERTMVSPPDAESGADWRAQLGLSLLSVVVLQSQDMANMLLRALGGRVDTLVHYCPHSWSAIKLIELLCSHSKDAFDGLLRRPDLVAELVSVLQSTVPMLDVRIGRTLSMLAAHGSPEHLPQLFSAETVRQVMREIRLLSSMLTEYDESNEQHCFVRALYYLIHKGPEACAEAFCTGHEGTTVLLGMLFRSNSIKHTSELLGVVARLCNTHPRIGRYLRDAKLGDSIRQCAKHQVERQPILRKNAFYIQSVQEAIESLKERA